MPSIEGVPDPQLVPPGESEPVGPSAHGFSRSVVGLRKSSGSGSSESTQRQIPNMAFLAWVPNEEESGDISSDERSPT